jgi:hypothetical protein
MVNPAKTLEPRQGSLSLSIKWNKYLVRPLKLCCQPQGAKIMVTPTDPKSANQSKWSGATIAYIIAAIVIIIGAYLLFANNATPPTTTPPVTENAPAPAPDATTPAPAPATPPAAETTPAPAPATPPATTQ